VSEETTSAKQDRIFSDKIKLWAMIIGFELEAIQEYESLFRRLRTGEIDEVDLERDSDYHLVWQQIISLFSFLEFGKGIKNLIKNDNKAYDRLKRIVLRYRKLDMTLSFADLNFSYDLIRKIMDLSGFHDLSSGKEKIDFIAPTQKW